MTPLLRKRSVQREAPCCDCHRGETWRGWMGIEPTQDASAAPRKRFLRPRGAPAPDHPQLEEMLFGQWNTDALDPERPRMAGEHSDQEPQHPVHRRSARDRGHQRRFGRPESAQLALLGDTCKPSASGWNERDPNARIAFAGVDKGQRLLTPTPPCPDLLPLDPPLQRAQEALATRVLTGVDRNVHVLNNSQLCAGRRTELTKSAPRAWPSGRLSCWGGSRRSAPPPSHP